MKDKNQKLVTEKGYKRMIAKTIMSPLIYLVVIVMLATNNQILAPEKNITNLILIAVMAAYTVSILYSELRLRASRVEQLKLGFENAIGKIMYPGDPSADGANVYNCRCTIAAKVIGFKRIR